MNGDVFRGGDADEYPTALHADDRHTDAFADDYRFTHSSRKYQHGGWSLAQLEKPWRLSVRIETFLARYPCGRRLPVSPCRY
jgi:hypothetical protein